MECPDSFETIVQHLLVSVGESVPNVNDIIFTSRENDWNIRMKGNSSNIVLMAIKSVQTLLRLIVPHLNLTVITSRYQMRSLMIMSKINTIYTRLMTNKTKISIAFRCCNGPNLDSPVKRG